MLRKGLAIAALALGLGTTNAAMAGDYNGNFMIRLQGTGVITQDKVKSLTALPNTDLKALGFDASVSNEFVPTATLSYFLTKNVALELFCCFAKHSVKLEPPAAAAGLAGGIADSWIFPPAVTLQYHFDGLGALKPYVGVGAQYIHFFNSRTDDNMLQTTGVKFSDAFGPTLQAGIDLQLGNGWYLNAEIKKSWLDTKATWTNSAVTGTDIQAKVDLDPLIVSAGVGYRFNLDELFGGRGTQSLK
jgi:outer membrane protein